ncbi:hypothetical protein CR513_22065, partial [Mucuna pruriens]
MGQKLLLQELETYISPTIILKDVLNVPKLLANLVFIKKLNNYLNCYATLFPSYCVLQEQGLGNKIGLAKERNAFTTSKPKSKKNLSFSFLSYSNKDVVWLHHLHLGHPSFNILKLMFPQLFQGLDVSKFHCDACELAKHTRVPFPSSNKSYHPSDLVDSDVWGPFVVFSIFEDWFLSLIDDCTQKLLLIKCCLHTSLHKASSIIHHELIHPNKMG